MSLLTLVLGMLLLVVFAVVYGKPFTVLRNWQKHLNWLGFFVLSPFLLFTVLTVINPAYMLKFFSPLAGNPWMGPALLAIASGLAFFNIPLCGVFSGLIQNEGRTPYTTVRLVLTWLLAFIFWMGSCVVILFTPALFVMIEQLQAR